MRNVYIHVSHLRKISCENGHSAWNRLTAFTFSRGSLCSNIPTNSGIIWANITRYDRMCCRLVLAGTWEIQDLVDAAPACRSEASEPSWEKSARCRRVWTFVFLTNSAFFSDVQPILSLSLFLSFYSTPFVHLVRARLFKEPEVIL